MNYLEQLAAEWYSYQGYFVRTNVKARKLTRGGHGAELDALAYKPKERHLVHLELSGAAESAHKQKGKFLKKFELTVDEYANVLSVEIEKLERVAVAGWGRTTREKCAWGNEISVMTIPKFYAEIVSRLRTVDPAREMMPEGFPLLRTVQAVVWALKGGV